MGQGVSKEQIERAKAVPILDYLLSHEGNNFKRVGNAYYRRDPDHNSLSVSNNLWYWHSHGVGGNLIDYLIKINGYSFVDAVRELAGDDYTPQRSFAPKARPPTLPVSKSTPPTSDREPLQLPPRNGDNKRVIAYLQGRGIDRSIAEDCIRRGLLYENANYHNCVFVGRDDNGKARFAAMRGTMGDFKDDGEPESTSITNQRDMLIKYAEQNGYTPYICLSDDGRTGTNYQRPGWQELMELVEADKVGAIILKSLDRMGRNYLESGMLREMFAEKQIRLIAMNDGVDTFDHPDDFIPFREIMAEHYARDTSRKVKSVLHAKGKRGEHMTNIASYGYRKSPDDKNLWLIDPESAAVVRRVFDMTINGKGNSQIARIFTDEKILRPSAAIALRDGREIADPDDKYNWSATGINRILDRQEYMGDTVNFRTRKVSFKSKKMVVNPPDEWQIFRDTHEPIVSREVWETAQKCRVVKRRPTSAGEPNPLTGLVYCGDCGGRMYNHRGRRADDYPSQDNYDCTHYTQYPRKCTSHYISTKNLRAVALEAIRSVSAFVKDNEAEFMRLVREESESQIAEGAKESKRKLARDKKRVVELDKLIKSLFEDKTNGALSPKRFEVLSRDYEAEQEQLEAAIEEAEASLAVFAEDTNKAERFIEIVRKYTDFSELTAAMLNEYVESIRVFAAERIDNRRRQRVEVRLNFIGQFNPPITDEPAEETPPPPDPIERRRERGRNSYYRNREKVLARQAAQRAEAKAAKLAAEEAAQQAKTPEELAAEEAERIERKRKYKRDWQRESQRKKRAERNAAMSAGQPAVATA